jgi:V/A-type H+-transporting ATPase subunit I
LAIGFVLSFIFSNYEGSVGKSVLESCKNIISVLLGVVNVFSDTVSYIRLWAVGLAGAAISNTVNTMAGPMLGKLAFFMVAVVLLVFGHGLNMVLNLLSVVVHGVRLNTLEFSQHLGMTWSGTKYSPFRERA